MCLTIKAMIVTMVLLTDEFRDSFLDLNRDRIGKQIA